MKTNYTPGSESFSAGFLGPKGDVGYDMLVDGKKTVKIVKELLAAGRSIERAELGLDGDWDCNNTVIYDGKFHKYDSYGASIWATPTLIVHFTDASNEAYECFSKGESNQS